MESADYNTAPTVNMFFEKLTHDCKFSRLLNPFVFFGYYKFRVFEVLAHIIQNSPSKIFQTHCVLYVHDNYNGLVIVLRNGNEIIYLCIFRHYQSKLPFF